MALRGKYSNSHPLWQMLLWMGIALFLTILLLSLWAMVPHGQDVAAMKWLQLWQTVAVFLLPAAAVAYLCSHQPLSWLHLDKGVSAGAALCGILLMLLAIPGINLISYYNQQMQLPESLAGLEAMMKQMEEQAALLTEQFIRADNVGILVLNVLLMAVLPGLAEEVSFRGVVMRLFCPSALSEASRTRVHISIWCTAILFSAIHFQFYGFVPRMLLGALFGYALWWSGSLWLPILMHTINNATAVLCYYVANRLAWDTEAIDQLGTGNTLWLGIASILITLGMIALMQRLLSSTNR